MPDTLAYLQEVNASFLENLKDGDVETSRMLLWNVLEEIAPRVASAASDRHACEFIEVLVDHMSAQQLRFFLHKMEGYFSHLWTNRYSSHVLQRLLSKVGAIVGNEVKGEADDDDDPDRAADVPPMSSLIVTMCSEVQAEWLTLINDVSASHVMRAVFCALAGRAPVLEKRGKKGKHKALQFQSAQTTNAESVPREFEDTLSEMLELVLGSSDGRLVELMSDAHAGPVLSMAVRVAPTAVQSKVIFKLLKWNDPERSSQRFYDFAADSVASHFLEAVCHSCDEDVWAAIFERCLQGRLLEFSEHPISNFVVQNFIQRTPTSDLNSRLTLNVPGARIVETLLKFPTDVSEPIWASDNQDAKLALFEKLQGQFGSLVLDRNGSFTVLKCFDVVSVAEKRKKKVKELFSDFMDDQAPKKKRKHDKKDGKKSKKKAKADE
ncbi:hypothetical protein DYB37_011044 [Aphanomyces astaci]|uniref:PUM-HD domain-containing protein n=1 Tax=Aphanomyces astaci TaxID=112090 RepID=A0A418F9N7_APHAT|nr:hypothetical protein DYB37_011044 [Aphanomyces astaci]